MANGSYFADMITPLEVIPETFCSWIKAEIREGGLLEEIDKFVQTYRTEGSVLNYEIWVYKMDWTVDNETSSVVSKDSYITIEYPFQVAVIVDNLGDEEESEQKAIQLQAKTMMSIFTNYTRNIFEDNRIGYINYFTIDEGYNDGSLNPANREDDVIIKGFKITLNVDINYLMCYQLYINEKGGN